MKNPNGLSSYEKHILEKLNHVRPVCGEDNSKERYRYLQWISCKNAVIEAMRDNHQGIEGIVDKMKGDTNGVHET